MPAISIDKRIPEIAHDGVQAVIEQDGVKLRAKTFGLRFRVYCADDEDAAKAEALFDAIFAKAGQEYKSALSGIGLKTRSATLVRVDD